MGRICVCQFYGLAPSTVRVIGQCHVQRPVTHWVHIMAVTNQEHNEG